MTATTTSTDRIEKQIVLDATQSRVWRAVTDYREFNSWFGVALTTPFTVGGKSSGNITIKGYEHMVMDVWVEKIEPQPSSPFVGIRTPSTRTSTIRRIPTTLVSFTLEEVKEGTKLTIVETGFDALPEWRRAQAFKSNDSGWASQDQAHRRVHSREPLALSRSARARPAPRWRLRDRCRAIRCSGKDGSSRARATSGSSASERIARAACCSRRRISPRP